MNCQGCKWWSEMIAESIGCGPIKAMCLNPDSPKFNRMVNTDCDEFCDGTPIDDPSLRCEL